MELKVLSETPELIRVRLSGTLDSSGVGEVEDDLKLSVVRAGYQQSAIVDLSGVSYMTSEGLRLLISVSRLVKRKGAKFVLLKPQRTVAEVIQISGLSNLLGVAMDEAAVESMLSNKTD